MKTEKWGFVKSSIFFVLIFPLFRIFGEDKLHLGRTFSCKHESSSLKLHYLSSKTIYENAWKRHPQRVLISLLFPIWHTASVSVIHYHGVHTLSLLLSSTSLVSLCRCPTPYRVSANLRTGLRCTTKIVTLHGKVYRMANWP